MTAMSDLRRATDLVPANLRAAARKVLAYDELVEHYSSPGMLASEARYAAMAGRGTALEIWQALTGLVDYREALALAREIAND